MANTKLKVEDELITTEEIMEYFAEMEKQKTPVLERRTTSDKYTNCNLTTTDSDEKKQPRSNSSLPLMVIGKAIKLRERTPTDDFQINNIPIVEYTSEWFQEPKKNLEPGKGLVFNRFAEPKKKKTESQEKFVLYPDPDPLIVKRGLVIIGKAINLREKVEADDFQGKHLPVVNITDKWLKKDEVDPNGNDMKKYPIISITQKFVVPKEKKKPKKEKPSQFSEYVRRNFEGVSSTEAIVAYLLNK